MGVQTKTLLAPLVVLILAMKAYQFPAYNYPQEPLNSQRGQMSKPGSDCLRYFLTACHFSVTKVTVFTFACK